MALLDFLGTRWEAGGWIIFFFLLVSHMGSKLDPWGSLLLGGCGIRVLTSGRWLAVVALSCHPALTLAGSLALPPFSAPLCQQLSFFTSSRRLPGFPTLSPQTYSAE